VELAELARLADPGDEAAGLVCRIELVDGVSRQVGDEEVPVPQGPQVIGL
jgi:hypothetical protein